MMMVAGNSQACGHATAWKRPRYSQACGHATAGKGHATARPAASLQPGLWPRYCQACVHATAGLAATLQPRQGHATARTRPRNSREKGLSVFRY